MTAPAGLVGGALLVWGWSIDQLALGIVLAAAYEVARAAGLAGRLAPRAETLARGVSLAAVVLLVYTLAAQSPPQSLYTWLRWLPVLFLPAALLGTYRGLDTTHAYAVVALAAAGTGTHAAPWLYPAYVALAGWALLVRARWRVPAVLMFLGAAAFGHAIHTGTWLLQGEVEEISTELFLQLFSGKADAFRERTRIGEMGRIKLSDRIAMRVDVAGPRPDALLLRESSFELYRGGEWRSARPTPRTPAREGDRWTFSEAPAGKRLTVRRTYPGGEGLLPLPPGTRAVDALPADSVEVFASGTARVRGAPRFVAFAADYDPAGERDPPNAALDLDIPANLAATLERTIAANGLRQPTAAASVQAVAAFFGRHFAYSLDLGKTPRTLADFLLTERRGHCEYFASATVMLLRALGVPARYAAGYSAQEYSALERAFVVRNRHAHAWVTAWVDGRWIEVDTTPAAWADFEREESRSFFGPVLDWFSWAWDRAVQWWLGLSRDAFERLASALGGAAIALAALAGLAWQFRRRWGAFGRARADAVTRAWRKAEARLAGSAHARREDETAREWAERLLRERPGEAWREGLAELARAYYVARFDPAASEATRAGFIAATSRWRPTP
jgi:transglutaminase-like putative cysteine protease